MTTIDIADLRALLELATPRPWEYLNTSGTIVQKIDRLTTYVIAEMQTSNETIDAKLIVAAINALPSLLDRLEAGEAAAMEADTAGRAAMAGYLKAQERIALLEDTLRQIMELPGEINPANYDADDVETLNNSHIEAYQIAASALQQKADTP